MTDEYKDYPESIAERRANAAEMASLWTPRDAIISILRDIDNGTLNPFVVFIALGQIVSKDEEPGPGTKTTFRVAGPDSYSIQGVAQRALFMFNEQ